MGVPAVDGYGTITSSNAYDIYTAYKKGEVDLTVAQQKRCESFLSADEINEIDDVTYTSETGEQTGKDALGEDVENAENKNTGAAATSAVVATAGNIAALATFPLLAMLAIAADGFTALALGTAAVATSATTIAFAKLFDTDYNDRKQAKDNADNTNATIDEYTELLEETLDEMNDDMDEYQAQSDILTTMLNENTSVMADLQIQLATAQSAGDTEGVKALQEQMKQIQGADFSDQEEDLSDLADKLEDYGELNDESMGVADGSQSIADFLQPGTALGVTAWVNVALLLAAEAAAGLAATGCSPKLAPFFPDFPTSIAAKVMYGLCAASFGIACNMMKNKATNEVECGSASREMQEHVNNLNEMISEQMDYIDTTDETYIDIDEESEESQAEAQEEADKAVESNSGSVGVTIGASSGNDDDNNIFSKKIV